MQSHCQSRSQCQPRAPAHTGHNVPPVAIPWKKSPPAVLLPLDFLNARPNLITFLALMAGTHLHVGPDAAEQINGG